MPGVPRCGRCGSALTAPAKVNVHPPRAGLRLIPRPVGYLLNRIGNVFRSSSGSLDERLEKLLGGFRDSFLMLLSIVPGLGHLVGRRLRPIRYAWPIWLVTLAAGVAFFGTNGGSVVLGIAIAVHAWIAMNAGRVQLAFDTGGGRLLITLLMLVVVGWGLYGSIPRYVMRGVRASVPIPGDRIERDDFLLVSTWDYPNQARRGDTVLYRVRETRGIGLVVMGGQTMGKLLGFPGERITIEGETITVQKGVSAPEIFKLPAGYSPRPCSFVVPPRALFCFPAGFDNPEGLGELGNAERALLRAALGNAAFGRLFGAQGQALIEEEDQDAARPPEQAMAEIPVLFRVIALPTQEDVIGRASMVYNTWWNRRPLPRQPLEAAERPAQ